MAIHKISWRHLDDPVWGCSVHQVDWTGCSDEHKAELIDEYNMVDDMAGYQPRTDEERYSYEQLDSILDKFINYVAFLAIGPVASYFLWVNMLAEGAPVFPILILNFLLIFPIYMISIVLGGILGFCYAGVMSKIHSIKRAKQKKEDDFNKWIRSCRK